MNKRFLFVGAVLLIAFIAFLLFGVSFSECNRLSSYNRTICFTNAALRSQNPDVCNSIGNMTDRSSCIKGVAIDSNNAAVCDRIAESRIEDSCILEVARRIGEASLCSKIVSGTKRDECYSWLASEKGNESLCGFVSERNRDACFSDVASR